MYVFANDTLLDKGYTNLDTSLNKTLVWTLTNHSLSLESFEIEDFELAFYYANLSYVASKDYYIYAENFGEVTTTTTITEPTTTTETTTESTTTTTNTTTTTTETTTNTTATMTETTELTTPTTTSTTPTTTNGFTLFGLVSLMVCSTILIRRRSKI